MKDLRNRYDAVLALPLNGHDSGSIKAALERAYALRDFEIEHYWKRATYFWGFQIAIFAAFGLMWKNTASTGNHPIEVALAVLGTLTALANSLSAKGSKFWHQNWEKHIDMLEDGLHGRLHKTVWLPNGTVAFSVSRINQCLNNIFVLFWLFVFLYTAFKVIDCHSGAWCNSRVYELVCWIGVPVHYVIASVLIGMSGAYALLRQRSLLDRYFQDAEGNRKFFQAKVNCCAKVKWKETKNDVAKNNGREFLSRNAPGEAAGKQNG